MRHYYYQIAIKCHLNTIGISPPGETLAVQNGPTSITVTWTASSDATGYRISYTSDSDSGSVDVDGGNTNNHTLMGLTNGEIYTISIMGTASPSSVLPSAPVEAGTVALSKTKVYIVKPTPFAACIPHVCPCTCTLCTYFLTDGYKVCQ